MSVKNTQGDQTNTNNTLPVSGTEGISVTETNSSLLIGVDIPSLIEDTTPEPSDYLLIHQDVEGTKKKIALAYLESLGNLSAHVDVYTATGPNQPWTKPAGAKFIEIVLFGGGGGGGTGAMRATSLDRCGGAGGGGGAYFRALFHADMFDSTGYVAIGQGGLPSFVTRSPSEIGRSGSGGGSTYFKGIKTDLYHLYALGGAGGEGGTAAGNAGGGGGGTLAGETGGGGGSTTDGPPYSAGAGGSPLIAAAGGGGGGGFDSSSNAIYNGRDGGRVQTSGMSAALGGVGEGAHGANGTSGIMTGGGGGAGGANSATASIDGGHGGNGGFPGGGGGGGGSGTYDSSITPIGGIGGAGASGLAVIITYF